MSLVVYSDGEEVLITTPEFEEEFIQEWFHLGNRRLADYDREEFENVVEVNIGTRVYGDKPRKT